MPPNDHIVFVYDPIPLRDGDVILITENVENSKICSTALEEFKILDNNVTPEYMRFVTEYILQVSMTLYYCHKRGLIHGALGLK